MGDSGAIGWLLAHAAGGLLAFAVPRFLIALGIPFDRWIVAMGERVKVHLNREAVIWAMTVLTGLALYAGSVPFSKDHSWDPQVPEVLMRAWAMVQPVHVIALGIAVAIVGVAWQLTRGPEIVTRVVTAPAPAPPSVKPQAAIAPPPVAKPTPEPPPQRPLSAYEAELKVRAIDKILKILSIDMQPVVDKFPLQQNWWNALKDPNNNSTFRPDLIAFRDEFKAVCLELDSLLNEIPEYQDLIGMARQPNYTKTLQAIEKYMIQFMYVQDTVKPNASKEALLAFMDDFMTAQYNAMNEFIGWRNGTRSKVLELRRQISP